MTRCRARFSTSEMCMLGRLRVGVGGSWRVGASGCIPVVLYDMVGIQYGMKSEFQRVGKCATLGNNSQSRLSVRHGYTKSTTVETPKYRWMEYRRISVKE
jgi:hypothetical protein